MTVLSVLSPSKARFNRKPDSRLPIDWSVPIAKGLKFYTTCGHSVVRDSVRGLKASWTELEWEGQDIRTLAAGQGAVNFPSVADDDVALGDYDWTILVNAHWSTAVGAAGTINRRTSTEPFNGFWSMYVQTTLRWSIYSGGSQQNWNFNAIFHGPQHYAYVLKYNAAADEATMYRLGRASDYVSQTLTGVAPPSGENNHELCLGRLISDTDGNGLLASFKEAAIWHRCLTDAEIRTLWESPLYSRVLVPDFLPTPFKAVAAPPASGVAPIVLSNQETICR